MQPLVDPATLPDESVNIVLASLPVVESDPDAYVERMTDLLVAASRTLVKNGTMWVLIPDEKIDGCVAGVPWRIALNLQAAGLYLRQDIIAAVDREHRAHDYLFLLSRETRYHYDIDAVSEPADTAGQVVKSKGGKYDDGTGNPLQGYETHVVGERLVKATRNRRSVWFYANPMDGAVRAGCPAGGNALVLFDEDGLCSDALDVRDRSDNVAGIGVDTERPTERSTSEMEEWFDD